MADATKLRNDFYDAINGEWIKKAEIPSDHSSTGGFMDLVDDVDEKLMGDFADMKAGKLTNDDPLITEFLKFYDVAANFEKRDQDGATPLKPFLEKVEAISSFEDLNKQFKDWILTGFPVPFDIGVEPDLKSQGKTKLNVLWAEGGSLILPDKTYYDKDNQAGPQLLAVFTQMAEKLLTMVGKSEDEAKKIVADAKKFDASMAPFKKNSEEMSDVAKLYNPIEFSEFVKELGEFKVGDAISDLLGETPKQVIVTEPKFFENFTKVVNEETFPAFKNWLIVNTITQLAGYLSEEFRQVSGTYHRALSGQKEAMKQQKSAFYLARRTFSQVVGDYYGKKYFGEKAKQDVHDMVVAMTGVYKQRLQNNTWLSKATREKAVVKLSAMDIHVGYPDKMEEVYKRLQTTAVADGGTLLGNVQKFAKIFTEDQLSKYNKPVDKEKWEMSADTVNAYYSPEGNLICFPAAILQAPFYSLKQSASENYGGIGAVMAHEISHAFDPNGALFDENGSLHNWWTETDMKEFKKRSQAMIEEFDGLPFAGGKVNGKLVVTENVADDGGLSCALEAAKHTDDPDLKAFFVNWARVWRSKATKEYEQLLLSIDVHAPAKLRANVQVKNFDEFYETFRVQPGDGMYLKPEKRVQIW
ncbi:M13 family metallopeptidase [Pediococcus ethanolidurans]|uniref:M13 family metallopeptidase n=1 Tax=Pediococcus ethanolidurans TaxID=319653 RepID=UPI001C1EDF19|nr:M13-type metalloendopeptidase [Pediococcus ethanolidurans]MBU7555825.1 M13 family peptidase [Pediococcus ethanolidurans]MBU7564217.1 M13 family peptidase [Pediococcus ethanolidurans]MCT4398447.1 M13 family peptidase [Pediococcus ethanolidurans]MCV3315855.1 M13 family peptidase [Pediococcus ethanolidurans]MCV3322420.1 M13 family peptidase [Pediococcus ethanolidurans]